MIRKSLFGLLLVAIASATTVATSNGRRHSDKSFVRIGTFANYKNNPTASAVTASEIVAATADGRTLVYSDGLLGAIGFINISNPARPTAGGRVTFPAGHSPTSVDVLGNTFALVGVSSRVSFTNPSGYLAVVNLSSRAIVRQIDLGGQPDSVKVSPDGRYAAVVVENERDEEVNDGELPQLPAGYLAIIDLTTSNPFAWTRFDVALTGLAGYAENDPEPEFVDINSRNQAVVTLQENNHIVVVDLKTRRIVSDFPAGSMSLKGVDTEEDGVIALKGSLQDIPREPDAVAWVPGPGDRPQIATANEGDLFGGSRGFSIFRQNGTVAFDSGALLEEIAVRHGHYPESRSENKGTEPEAIEYARFGNTDYLFVASERGSFVAVFTLDSVGRPEFDQLLPAPIAPEGILAIPQRNLLIASGEEDAGGLGGRSTVMIYELKRGEPTYPQIVSDDRKSPIAWSALSGLVAAPDERDTLLAVWDGYYSESRILRVDVSETPAVITSSQAIRGGSGNFDPEGVAVAPDRTIWVATEGDADDDRRNLLLQLNRNGQVLQEINLPNQILQCRKASTKRGTLGSGFEGVAVLRDTATSYRLIVAQQRGWDYTTPEWENLDDDDGGLNSAGEPNRTRLWIYDPRARTWSHIAWELAPKPANASWVGLSEITELPWGAYVVIERDNRTGDFAELKTLVKVTIQDAADRLIRNSEKARFDLLPRLKATNGWITDKPEGFAVTSDGRAFVVTDNDGVEDWSGETWFLNLGQYWRLF